jgi:hypothetical protein
MTHPTKAIMYNILNDFLKMAAGSADEKVGASGRVGLAGARAGGRAGGATESGLTATAAHVNPSPASRPLQLYDANDLKLAMEKAEVVDFEQTLDLGGGLKVGPALRAQGGAGSAGVGCCMLPLPL